MSKRELPPNTSCQSKIKKIPHTRNQMLKTHTLMEGSSKKLIQRLLKRVSKTRISSMTSLLTIIQIRLFRQLKHLLRLSRMGLLQLFRKEEFLLAVILKPLIGLLITQRGRPHRKVELPHLEMGRLSLTMLFKSTQAESQRMLRKFQLIETETFWKTSNHQGINLRCEEQTSISKALKASLTSAVISEIRLQMLSLTTLQETDLGLTLILQESLEFHGPM